MDISALTISEIKRLAASPGGPGEELFRAMADDPRAGVRQLYLLLEKRRRNILEEEQRLAELFKYEDKLRERGISIIAGVDEAGRGPLAGPVLAAAVVLPQRIELHGLNDSKQLTPARREALAIRIKKMSKAWAIGVSTVREIHQLNIYHASLLAMRRAVAGLKAEPQHVLADGFRISGLELPQTAIVGGDGQSASIAAASILAKVARDQLMELCHHLYPEYGFDRHKGYPTREHMEALYLYGPCPLHREGFAPVRNLSD